MGFFSWLKKKPYSACSEGEKFHIHSQIRAIVQKANTNYVHMLIPNQLLLSIRLADMTPIHITIAEFARIVAEEDMIGGRQFIVSYGTNSYGEYIFHFVCGGDMPTAPSPEKTLDVEYTEL